MAKQSQEGKTELAAPPPAQTKVSRRRRRRPSQQRGRTEHRGKLHPGNSNHAPQEPDQRLVAWTRAPRPAEPPPPNPHIFSYTYTTWKTS